MSYWKDCLFQNTFNKSLLMLKQNRIYLQSSLLQTFISFSINWISWNIWHIQRNFRQYNKKVGILNSLSYQDMSFCMIGLRTLLEAKWMGQNLQKCKILCGKSLKLAWIFSISTGFNVFHLILLKLDCLLLSLQLTSRLTIKWIIWSMADFSKVKENSNPNHPNYLRIGYTPGEERKKDW